MGRLKSLIKNDVAKKVEIVGTIAQKAKVQGIVVKEVKPWGHRKNRGVL
jgi:hypothetical protein